MSDSELERVRFRQQVEALGPRMKKLEDRLTAIEQKLATLTGSCVPEKAFDPSELHTSGTAAH